VLSKLIRIIGLFSIIGFCAFSVAVFNLQKEIILTDLIGDGAKSFLKYPSFFEDRFYDIRMNLTIDRSQADDRLVMGAIDEKTLKELNSWPLDRVHWAKIIRKLKNFGAKVIAFDVIFSEPQRAYDGISPDLEMAKAIAEFQAEQGKKVILSYSLTYHGQEYDELAFKEVPPELYNFIMDANQAGSLGTYPRRVQSTTYPIPQLLKAEPGLSYIEGTEDVDGIFRRYPLLVNVDGLYFPSYSLLSYQYFTGDVPKLNVDPAGNATLKTKTGQLDLNYSGEAKIRWAGGVEVFPTFSLADLYTARDDDPDFHELVKDKLIFIGSTSFGAHDFRHTPVDPKLPGVYFHMNMVKMLLDAKFYQPRDKSLLWSWGILILGTFIMIMVSLLHNPVLDFFIVLLFSAGIFATDVFYFLPAGYQITLFFSLLSVVGTYSWNTFLNFYLASKDKAFLKSAFGNYISPELIDEMYASGKAPSLGGDVGVRTAYFTDIQGFSTFSEKLTAPKLVELLNEYLTAMTDILLEEKGTLDKYEGDAIIAFFGAPLPLEDHATRAVRVAARMQASLLKLREKWVSEGDKWPEIVHGMRMRIGVNSGEIVTGNMGSTQRMNYTMMGDSVNLAARLEEAAKQYGIFTQVSKATKELCEDIFEWRELDTLRVVGKSEPITTFELLALKTEIDEVTLNLKNSFSEALELYKSQKWDEAIAAFQKSLEFEWLRFPALKGVKTNPSEIYIKRAEEYKENPPGDDWDGVYTLTSK
jgi:adenylate cyclase